MSFHDFRCAQPPRHASPALDPAEHARADALHLVCGRCFDGRASRPKSGLKRGRGLHLRAGKPLSGTGRCCPQTAALFYHLKKTCECESNRTQPPTRLPCQHEEEAAGVSAIPILRVIGSGRRGRRRGSRQAALRVVGCRRAQRVGLHARFGDRLSGRLCPACRRCRCRHQSG